MYAVVCCNDKKVNFLATFSSCPKAIRSARKYAEAKYGENIYDKICNDLCVQDTIMEFSNGQGNDVYCVISLPVEDEMETSSICSCDDISKNDENLVLYHKNSCRRRSSVDRKLFLTRETYVDQNTKTEFLVFISDNEDSETDSDTDIDTDNENYIDTDNENEIETDNEKDNQSENSEIDPEYYYDFDDFDDFDYYDDRYDDRYDDYGDYGGYEDECYECLDL